MSAKFAVLGHPISHSFSPVMHTASFRSIGFDGEYTRQDVAPEVLREALDALAAEGFSGVNLTIPHKILAVPMMDVLSPEAEMLGAVNTVRFLDGKLYGHNTDGPGFLAAAKHMLGYEPAGTRAAVIGCGGAGRAIAVSLAMGGVAAIDLIDVDAQRASNLAAELMSRFPVKASAGSRADIARADLVAQCSPSGLPVFPGPAVTADEFREGQKLFDIVIPPGAPVTPTMAEAMKAGVRCCNGIRMLVEQGALSFAYWTDGVQADREAMFEAVTKGVRIHE